MKRIALLTLMIWMAFMPKAYAVLKEKDLDNTLTVLRVELKDYHDELERQSGFVKEQNQEVFEQVRTILSQSSQNSLMLYSQKPGYVFDLTYVCHEATEQFNKFKKNVQPFQAMVNRINGEIARYDSLINNLNNMPKMMLSNKAKIDRNVCLTLAVNIRRTLKANSDQLSEYIQYYQNTEDHLRYLHDYANKRYDEIQTSIFRNGGDNYLKILSHFGSKLQMTSDVVSDKYKPMGRIRSQWDIKVIAFLFEMIIICACAAFLLNMLVYRFIVSRLKQPEWLKNKHKCVVLTTTVVTLALILGIMRLIFQEQNFIIMASGLLVEYAWLLGVILISLLIRLNDSQIWNALKVYSPLLLIGFLVISFRIVLIPNDLVNLFFPPILLICAVWQWVVIKRHNGKIPRSDVFYSYVSLAVFLASVVCSWIGYTLLSVQLLIWWIMQLTCILTITCISDYLKAWNQRKNFTSKPITKTWFFNLIYHVVLPVLAVFSIVISIYWAADVFNLGDTTQMIFRKRFIDSKNFSVSIFSISQVVTLWFVFSYINKTLQAFAKLHFDRIDKNSSSSRSIMAKNVIQLLVWGTWLLISLGILHVNNTWLVVVSGGLSTGVGFAMKDIIENIYYGISLMAGRVKVGDYIYCDGTRGRVSSINFTSTLLEAVDGSVIAFQNSQLFTKNYKNLTKNHGFELHILEVGVAYGTNIKQCKKVLIDALKKLDFLQKGKEPNIVLKSFDDSAINLKILVWVPVLTQYIDDGSVLECVYETLQENNIEIPFPQRDIHIINSPT
ncbi:MAG: mechanosensitive ion channel [Prevotella sp.]|nr:mechanosensitive ion channel [Prevotella sp.]